MLDPRGFVAETDATHVFLVERGTVLTSRLVACPEGITLANVLEICRAEAITHADRGIRAARAWLHVASGHQQR